MSLEYELSHTRTQYRRIFGEARTFLLQQFAGRLKAFDCSECTETPDISTEDAAEAALLNKFHPGCGYRHWQQSVLNLIEQEIARDVFSKLQAMETEKRRIACQHCGVCCRLASSEFSYEELRKKAAAGDSFARQFTSVFLPYASTESARKRFPDIVQQVLALAGSGSEESVHFYHCPYIGEDNRCTLYGTSKRPDICESYPDTPLTFIYDKCAWKPWKDSHHEPALLAHALIEMCTFLADKLHDRLETTPAHPG